MQLASENDYYVGQAGNCIFEYFKDSRYQTSHRDTIVIGYSDIYNQYFKVKQGDSWNTVAPTGVTVEHGRHKRYTALRCLRQWSPTDDAPTYYTPCVVFGNGEDPTLVYHQADDGVDKIEALESIDGGFSDQTYLGEPPRAKFFVEHKKRIFALNCSDGSNRVYTSGPNDAGVWSANVWPSSYNFDVGDGAPLTGAISLGDQMLIFKEHEIWVLSGEGYDGAWSLQRIDDQNGSLPYCIVKCEAGIYFMNRVGIYRWDGSARRISHPRLQNAWRQCSWTDNVGAVQKKIWFAIYDPMGKRILFAIGYKNSIDGAFVYNTEVDTWDRWGAHPDSARELFHVGFPGWGSVVDHWSGNTSEIMGLYHYPLVFRENQYFDRPTISQEIPIHWYIMSHELFRDDNEYKYLRDGVVFGKKTGDWKLKFIPCFDGESLTKSWMYGVPSDQYNVVVDTDVNDREHDVNEPVNLDATYDSIGQVRIFDLRLLGQSYTLGGDRYLDEPSGSGKVKFLDSEDPLNNSGIPGGTILYSLKYVSDGSVEAKPPEEILFEMRDSTDAIYYENATGSTWDNAFWLDDMDEKFTQTINRYGTRVRIYLTNIGTLWIDGSGIDEPSQYTFAKKTNLDIVGWGFWYRRLGYVRRQ